MEVVQRELDDPRLEGMLPSVTRVKVAEDLATADVYMILMGQESRHSAALAALKGAAGRIRGRLGKALHTRTVPFLRIHLDEQYRKEMEVLNLIRQAEREREEREGVRDENDAVAPVEASTMKNGEEV